MHSSRQLRDAGEKLAELAPSFGREPSDIPCGLLCFTAIVNDDATAKQMAIDDMAVRYNQPFDRLVERYGLLGTPEQCLEQLQPCLEAGMRHIPCSLTCRNAAMADQIEQCAAATMPH